MYPINHVKRSLNYIQNYNYIIIFFVLLFVRQNFWKIRDMALACPL